MKHRLLTILPTVLLAAGFSLEGAVLAEKNKSFPQIILPGAKPVQQQKIAEGELKEFIGKIIGDKAPAAKGAFRITLTDLSIPGQQIPADIVKRLKASPKEDVFYLRGTKNSLLIVGKTPRSLVYGACFFLHKYAGITWVYPGTQGEAYLKRDKIVIPDKIEDYQAGFTEFRINHYNQHDRKDVPWTIDDAVKWQYRNLCLPLPRWYQMKDYKSIAHADLPGDGHHTFCFAVPNTYFEKHPEYFPLINGKRTKCCCLSRNKQLPWVQRCVSNPEVHDLMVKHILTQVRKNPAGYFGICAADKKLAWCSCSECRKYGTLNGKFSISNLYYRFYKSVTDAVLKQVPDAHLWIYIYLDYRELPTDPKFKFDPRVHAIYYAHGRCIAHPLNDPECEINHIYHKTYLDWSRVFSRVGICDYYGNANTPYCPHEYNFAADAPERILRNDWGEREHITAQRYLDNWMFYLVKSKFWWDPKTDLETFIGETLDRYYGKSAAPMKRFQAVKRDLWKNAPGHAWYPGPNRGAYCLALPENQKKMEECLAEAEKLAGNDKLLLARIAMEKAAFRANWVRSAAIAREDLAAKRIFSAGSAGKNMKIDGLLEEPEWKKAEAVNHFVSPYTKNKMRENTNVRVLYDDNNFYISVECMNDKAWVPLIAKQHKRDDASICDDDSVEIFLCHPTNGLYYQIMVNSLGNYYDARMMNKNFDTGCEVASKVLKDRYIVEMRIPAAMTGIKKILPGQQWKLHVWRNIRNLQPPATVELGGIDGHSPHTPDRYRPILFKGVEAVKNSDFSKLKKDGKLADWTVTTPENFKLHKEKNGNYIELKGCKVFQFMNLSDTGHTDFKYQAPCRVMVSVTASGTGFVEVIPSTGSYKNNPFRHSQWKMMTADLTSQPKVYQFQFSLKENEGGYLFIGARNAKIYSITATKIPPEK